MNKREFLSKLEEALGYELPPRAVTENLRYYSSYIDAEIQKGRPAAEVLEELGDPRLIARTIIEAAKSGADGIPGTADDLEFHETPYSAGGYDYDSDTDYKTEDSYSKGEHTGFGGNINIHTYTGCMPCLLGILAAMFIFSAIMGLLAFFAPVLAPVAVVILICWLLGKADSK